MDGTPEARYISNPFLCSTIHGSTYMYVLAPSTTLTKRRPGNKAMCVQHGAEVANQEIVIDCLYNDLVNIVTAVNP